MLGENYKVVKKPCHLLGNIKLVRLQGEGERSIA